MRHINKVDRQIAAMPHFSKEKLRNAGIESETRIPQPIQSFGPLVPIGDNSLYTSKPATRQDHILFLQGRGKRNSTTSAPLPVYLQTRNKFPKRGRSRRSLEKLINPPKKIENLKASEWLAKYTAKAYLG